MDPIGYSKAEVVAGTIPIFYGVYAEVLYEDNSVYVTSALFFEGMCIHSKEDIEMRMKHESHVNLRIS